MKGLVIVVIALITCLDGSCAQTEAFTDSLKITELNRNYFKNIPQAELPETYFAIALSLALQGEYKESIRFHKKAIRSHRRLLKSEPLEISLNLGLTYYLAGKKQKAKKYIGRDFLTS